MKESYHYDMWPSKETQKQWMMNHKRFIFHESEDGKKQESVGINIIDFNFRVISGSQATNKGKHISKFPTVIVMKEQLPIDVIGTVVSVSDAIPFNNYGKDQLRRTIILEDV
ncbi:hypothetical protein Tco_1436550, partial [Tanacetum coccineum]